MKGRKRRMNGLQKEIENKQTPSRADAFGEWRCGNKLRGLEASPGRN